MSDGKIVIETGVDTKGAERDTRSLAGKLSGSLGKIATMMASAFAVKQLITFGKACTEVASNLQEVQNVVDTAFGSMTYKMEEFADSAIDMYGISKLTAKQTGSTFMAMAKGLGMSAENASDMAISLTALSADMSSFYNVSQDATSCIEIHLHRRDGDLEAIRNCYDTNQPSRVRKAKRESQKIFKR